MPLLVDHDNEFDPFRCSVHDDIAPRQSLVTIHSTAHSMLYAANGLKRMRMSHSRLASASDGSQGHYRMVTREPWLRLRN
jgi:hypothetical protein